MTKITIATAGAIAALGISGGGALLLSDAGAVPTIAAPSGAALERAVPDPAEPTMPDEPADEPLLTNGSAEEGEGDSPEAWSQGAAIPGVEYIWDRDAAHDGEASLCLKKTARRFFPIAQWFQEFDREGDTPRLRVVARVKADRAAKAILDVQFLDADGEWSHAWAASIGAKQPDDPPATHDWTQYEGVVAIPPGTERIIVAPQIYGPGTVWFDDLRAEYTDDPETDPTGP